MMITEIPPTEKIEIHDKYLLEARIQAALSMVGWLKVHLQHAKKAAKEDMPYCSAHCWNAFYDTQRVLEQLKMLTNDLVNHGFPED